MSNLQHGVTQVGSSLHILSRFCFIYIHTRSQNNNSLSRDASIHIYPPFFLGKDLVMSSLITSVYRCPSHLSQQGSAIALSSQMLASQQGRPLSTLSRGWLHHPELHPHPTPHLHAPCPRHIAHRGRWKHWQRVMRTHPVPPQLSRKGIRQQVAHRPPRQTPRHLVLFHSTVLLAESPDLHNPICQTESLVGANCTN